MVRSMEAGVCAMIAKVTVNRIQQESRGEMDGAWTVLSAACLGALGLWATVAQKQCSGLRGLGSDAG